MAGNEKKPVTGMTVVEAAQYLGVSQTTVNRWADTGLLPKPERTPDGLRFNSKAVEVLAETYIKGMNSGEVAIYLDVSRATVEKWAKVGILPVKGKTPIGSRRFDRMEVEKFAEARAKRMSTSAVARYLGVSHSTVSSWANIGALPEIKGKPGERRCFDRDGVAAFAKANAIDTEQMSVSEVARCIGVSLETVRIFANSGVLPDIEGSPAGTADRHRRFKREFVEAFAADKAKVERLSKEVHNLDVVHAGMTINEVARYLGVPYHTVWKWASTGILPEKGRLPGGQRCFDIESVKAFAASNVRVEGMSSGEVALYCGVSRLTVSNWADKGILPEKGRTPGGLRRFDKEAVKAFAETNLEGMSTVNVARYLGVLSGTVRKWVDEGKLKVIGRTPGGVRRFDRKAVEAFADTRNTAEASE